MMVGRIVIGGAAALAASGLLATAPAAVQASSAPPPAWTITPSPSLRINGHVHQNWLHGISCTSVDSCVAVGTALRGGPKTLAEIWDGTGWSIVPSGSGQAVGELFGVSCVTASGCTAVGFSDSSKLSSQFRTLVETWNGTAWARVRSPNPSTGTGRDSLAGVSCVSATFCVAVGTHAKNTSTAKTLIETWDGSTWSVVPSPNAGTSVATLNGVTCTAADNCTAVGNYETPGHITETLIESWDGSTWSVVPSPNAGAIADSLNGVFCVSARACTAVGSTSVGQEESQTLVESWDGSTWSVVPSPNVSGQFLNSLHSVSCVSASACIATGSYGLPLVEAWDGAQWSMVTTPKLPGNLPSGTLDGVSCVSAATCIAAGSRNPGIRARNARTLIEQGAATG